MKILIILRGAPGSGKSTFTEVMGLSPFTISSDKLRMQLSSLRLDPISGEMVIDMTQETQVEMWKEFYRLVEHRMKNGDFTVVDATHCRKVGFSRYRSLCQRYRYRAFVVDFSAVPLEVCLANNMKRPLYKRVPEEAIRNFHVYSRRKSELPGNWCQVIKPDLPSIFTQPSPSPSLPIHAPDGVFERLPQVGFEKGIQWRKVDLNSYEKVHYFGDLQGCYSPLQVYFKNHGTPAENPNQFYIFVGDLLDRGIENNLVLETCMQLAKRNNVVFIEGNHDTYLAKWANDEEVRSRDFKMNTVPQLLRLIPTLMTSNQEKHGKKEEEANGHEQNEVKEKEKEKQGIQGKEEKEKEKEKGGWKKAEEDPGLESLKREVRIFFRKFAQLHFHGFKVEGEEEEREVLVTHGGLSCIPPNLSLVSQKELIHGSGDFDFPVDSSFSKNCKPHQYQIHGHRNPLLLPTRVNPHCFNLEGGVEYGGFLRIVTLDHKNGFTTYEIKNNVSKFLLSSSSSSSSPKAVETKGQEEWLKQEPDALNQIFVIQLKSNTYVSEKTMIVKTGNSSPSPSPSSSSLSVEAPTGTRKGKSGEEEEEEDIWNPITISSFNFTEAAFNNKVWNAQTIKARGLFIDGKTNKVLARSYDKFFNVDEVPSVQQQAIPLNAKLPLTVYVKENGYLGIVSGLKFEKKREGEATCYRLLICSKSTCEGPFAQELRRLVFKHLEEKGRKEEEMAEELYKKNVSLVFEVISPQFDTHIIQYSKETLFLLDVIENRLTTFRRFSQEKREELARNYGFEPKKFFKKIESWEEYSEWFKDIQEGKGCKLEDGSEIEGFVVEDSREGRGKGVEGEGEEAFMFKIKLSFYRLWKYARSHKDSVARGKKPNFRNIKEPELKQFVNWLLTLDKSELKADIITLRNSWKQSLVLEAGEEEDKEETKI